MASKNINEMKRIGTRGEILFPTGKSSFSVEWEDGAEEEYNLVC